MSPTKLRRLFSRLTSSPRLIVEEVSHVRFAGSTDEGAEV
jgi:hypothetical protein